MKISVFPRYSALMGTPIMQAFIDSLKDCNEYVICNDKAEMDADVFVIWSILWNGRMEPNKQIWDYVRRNKKPVVVIEVGALNRGKSFKIGINGINRAGMFCNANSPRDRIEKFGISLKPWTKKGDDILICGQHEKSEQWKGMPSQSVYMAELIANLRKYTDRTIIIRPHPRFKFRLHGMFMQQNNVILQEPIYVDGRDNFDLPNSLDNCWAIISHSSNPAIEATINGIPAFVSDQSFCYELGNTDIKNIENPAYADREQWLADLTYTEWFEEEIRAGIPWQRIRPKLEEMVND